jgi:hypothetical protein
MDNYGKLIILYDLKNKKLLRLNDLDEKDVKNKILDKNNVLCFRITEKDKDFSLNDLNIKFENFPWETYFKINPDLSNPYNYNKQVAWHHWQYHGKIEERAFSYINNTNDHRARLGNLFFLNMGLHFFSIKFDLKSNYKYDNIFKKLGIYFFKGNNMYDRNLLLTDYNFIEILKSDISPQNIIINNDVWFHTRRFCKIIKRYFIEKNLFKKVLEKNLFKSRYDNNNDLFIHVRLGDVTSKTEHLFNYYNNTINSIKFNQGYITSDNINHDLCQRLIKKFNLITINSSEVETIMFGSTCKHIILSGGTFSWLIGFLGFKSENIFYPELNERWYGDVFCFSEWKKKQI